MRSSGKNATHVSRQGYVQHPENASSDEEKAYPDKGQNRDFPLKGIENARPETIEASKPRIDPKKVPFDALEAIKQVPEWENLDRGWGPGEG